MSAPVVADISNLPVYIYESVLNTAYLSTTTVTMSDLSMADDTTNAIVNILRESYKASSGAAVVDDPSTDLIYEEMLNMSSAQVLNMVLQSLTAGAIQSFGNMLIAVHMRDQYNPFQAGDVYTFPFVVKPGSFSVENDAPDGTAQGTTFFSTSVNDKPLHSNPGDIVTISQWIYTADASTGPYYEGTAEDGFIVTMAFKILEG